MRVQIVGEKRDSIDDILRRYLSTGVEFGQPSGHEEYICVLAGAGDLESILTDASLSLLVLVEPTIAARDGCVRALAARDRPQIEIVEHVAADLQSARTWALVQSLVHDLTGLEGHLWDSVVTQSHLVEGVGPPGIQPPADIAGLTMGFVGFGPMAHRVALLALASGLRLLYWPQFNDRTYLVESEGAALRAGARMASFPDLLSGSDIIVLDLQEDEGSIRLLDAPQLAVMREGALLVNTSHSRAVDEGSLIQALRDGHLGGAALDRFNYEPLPGDSPLRGLGRVLLTQGMALPDESRVNMETARRVANAIGQHLPEVRVRRLRRQVRRLPGS